MLVDFKYFAPSQKEELLNLLNDKGEKAKIFAGGTDLLPDIRAGLIFPSALVDVKKIQDLDGISFSQNQGLSIGPAVTINQLLENTHVKERYPILIKAGKQLASHQIRNRATVLGNLSNCSPCADMAPPLLCLNASIVISSKQGTRQLPLKDFFIGTKKSILKPTELLERVIIPIDMADSRGSYLKLKRIKGHDLAIVSVALVKKRGTIRIAIGSAAPTPVILRDFDINTKFNDICDEAVNAIHPIDDLRASAEYRMHMVKVFIERLTKEA